MGEFGNDKVALKMSIANSTKPTLAVKLTRHAFIPYAKITIENSEFDMDFATGAADRIAVTFDVTYPTRSTSELSSNKWRLLYDRDEDVWTGKVALEKADATRTQVTLARLS